MYAMKTAGNADIPVLPVTRRFDPRKHRRITGLFDLWLEPGPRGGLVLPARPDRLLTPRSIADLVRRSGEAANDVRILTDDGARHSGLLSEVAGLLAHDVLVGPDGAVIRHHAGRDGTGPLHAVPLDRASHRPKDWLVIQPPDLATPLPGWFTVDRGLVHPRKGVVGLPLRGGLVLATRADFVTRRATAHQLGTASGGLVTVAVTARAGGFLVGDYGGTQRVYSGGQLAALLGDLPLYGSDLRLWLTWPSDLDEQHVLAAQALALAETTGATVWTPPPGGGAELIDGQRDLRALDHAGEPVEWHAYRPRFATGPPVLRTTPDGLLVPASERPGVVLRAWSRPDRSPVAEAAPPADVRVLVPRGGDTALPLPDGPHAGPLEPHQEASDLHAFRATLRMLRAPDPPRSAPRHQAVPADPPPAPPPKKPPAVSLAPFPRPPLVVEGRRAPAYGPAWLPPRQYVNADEFEAFVVTPGGAWSVADGIPSAELFVVAFLDPKSVPPGSHLLRVRIGPGGAIPMAALRAHVPARLQHLRGLHEAYLLPAGRLNQVSTMDRFQVEGPGELVPAGESDGVSLRIRCTSSAHSLAGLPNDVRRWPTSGTRRAYALVPATRVPLPRGWLRLYRQPPPVQVGRLLLDLRVPRDRAIDVWSTADALAPLTRVRSQVERLRMARVELILGSRSYGRVRVRHAYAVDAGRWRRVRQLERGPLPAVLPWLQSSSPI
ncbi:hypothetical protein GCM10022251_75570 [Phytohabitans flavus]|uniref:Uncharacterized protein n=3 Tax=Phytohabitans flavus TaxID=1076124 RepID=A0A6F8XME4_9ACTN|nr:hypothetical protein Pflav_014020 [Phytohabitans flavus]